jgi:hypothetical protein
VKPVLSQYFTSGSAQGCAIVRVHNRSLMPLFTAECPTCEDLVLQYISAMNALLEIRARTAQDHGPQRADVKARNRLKEHLLRQLVTHKRNGHQHPAGHDRRI